MTQKAPFIFYLPPADRRGALLHPYLRAAQLPRSDDGVQWGLRVGAGALLQPRHLLLQSLGRLLDPLRTPKLPWPAVLHESWRVPQVQWLGGHLRHHRLFPQDHRVLILCYWYEQQNAPRADLTKLLDAVRKKLIKWAAVNDFLVDGE